MPELGFVARGGTLHDTANRRAIASALERVRAQGIVRSVSSPATQITHDGRIGVSTILYKGDFQ